MSYRGAITVECDAPGCHGELVLEAAALTWPLDLLLEERGWRIENDRRVMCEACVAVAQPEEHIRRG